MTKPLYQLDDGARLYVFAASRALTDAEIEAMSGDVAAFINGWQAHKNRVSAAYAWKDNRFLLIGIDETVTPLSGCSIDGLVRTVRGFESGMNVTFVDGDAVYFRDGGEIRRTGRAGFRELARDGKIGLDTIVFDTMVNRVGDLRAGKLEVPLKDSWHARLVHEELTGAQ